MSSWRTGTLDKKLGNKTCLLKYLKERKIKIFTVLFGCGGHARSILNTLINNENERAIILVDENAKRNEKIMKCICLNEYDLLGDDEYIIAIGDNLKRKELFDKYKYSNAKCVNVISKTALLGAGCKIGEGVFIAANAYIGPLVSIGDNCIINTGCVVEHEVVVGKHTHLAPNSTICGRTQIGNNVFCGAGSTIIDNLYICSNVIIGAGAVIIHDITEPGVYAGIPVRRIK